MSESAYAPFDLVTRPDPAALATLGKSSTTVISDVLAALGMHQHVIRGAQRLSGKVGQAAVVGTAITIDFAPIADSGGFAGAPYLASRVIERAQAGDVIVSATHGAAHAFWGEHMTEHALRRGINGAILDGCVRDVAAIRALGFPIFGWGATPDTLLPHYEAVGYNVRIVCGGVQIQAGDAVIADDDGAVVVPQRILVDVAEAVEKRQGLEEWAKDKTGGEADPFAVYDRIYRDAWGPGASESE